MEGVCSEKLNPDPIRTALGNASPYHWHIDSICTADQLYPIMVMRNGVTLLHIPRSRILRVMVG